MRYICVVHHNQYLPMEKKFTLLSTTEFAALVRKAIKQEKTTEPQKSTVRFLKDFARNYRANTNMPSGLQGYMLS